MGARGDDLGIVLPFLYSLLTTSKMKGSMKSSRGLRYRKEGRALFEQWQLEA